MNELNNDSNPLEPTSNDSQRRTQRSRGVFFVTVATILFITGIGIGFLLSPLQQSRGALDYDTASQLVNVDRSKNPVGDTVDFQLFWKVWDTIQKQYVHQPVDEVQLFYGALMGMTAMLEDPYSLFLPPEESQEFIEEINGDFGGIGAEVGIKDGVLKIVAPLPGSPAEKAGLLPGDYLVAVDHTETSSLNINEAVNRIRGEKGTSVTLTIQRGEEAAFDVVVQRDVIHIESVQWEMKEAGEKRIALITVSHFNSDTAAKFQEAVNAILLEQPDNLIIDLRNNAGGFLDAAVSIASHFIAEGNAVVYEQSSTKEEKPYNAKGPSALREIETVVLINGGSASASEILAGALQDYQKAMVIGTTSFGKGTVQNFVTFEDGSSLKLTVARWLTPKKGLIDAIGIHPDYEVERTDEDFSQDLDPPLEAAILYLTDRSAFEAAHQRYVPPPPTEETDSAIELSEEKTE